MAVIEGGESPIIGTEENDTLRGAEFQEDEVSQSVEIFGLGGDDLISGDFVEYSYPTVVVPQFEDTLSGGEGNDSIHGDSDVTSLNEVPTVEGQLVHEMASDFITGDSGDDVISGTSRSVLVRSFGGFEEGDDILLISYGDTIDGGDGNDVISGDAQFARVATVGAAAKATLLGGDDNLNGGADDDIIYGDFGRLIVGSEPDFFGIGTPIAIGGDDTIDGGDGDDVIWGDVGELIIGDGSTFIGGNDVIDGGEGNDTINGGGGDDIITGGRGNDIMTGGEGADVFVLTDKFGKDQVTDFTQGEDKIDVSLLGITSFDELQLQTTKSGDTKIKMMGARLEVSDVSDLTESDFIFDLM